MSSLVSGRFPSVSAGIDWLSIRTNEFDTANAYSALASDVFAERKAAGEKVESSVRVGFGGRSVDGLFLGHKDSTSLLTLSSETARKYAPVALRLGGSVARIDLQVTIDTGLERLNLASQSYYQAIAMPRKGGHPRELKLTQVHPMGDTLNVNKRSSDHFGRVYDYGAAHDAGARHQFWRYEIEFKRSMAKHIASTVIAHDDLAGVTEHLVHHWYVNRLPYVPFSPRQSSYTYDLMPGSKKRDVMRWFEESLSKSVGRAIKDYGERRVLTALGLSRYLPEHTEEV